MNAQQPGARTLTPPRARLAAAIAVIATAALAAPASAHQPARSSAVSDWSANAGKAALAACLAPDNDPLHESRLYAMTHIAIHDALNAIDRRSRPYAFAGRARRGASVDAAVAAAARGVLVPVLAEQTTEPLASCVGAGVASVEADYAAALDAIPDGRAKRRGLAVGGAAATAVVAQRAGDGADTTLFDADFPQVTTPGVWRFTPGTAFAFAPGWADVTPFVLRDASQYRPGPPYPLASRRYARDFNEIKEIGSLTSQTRTAEQTEIARFWLATPTAIWNVVARQVMQARGLDLSESARALALIYLASADASVACWTAKYTFNFWRPITAIRNGDVDDNASTEADPAWTPLFATPPHPEYLSGHSTNSSAMATVMMLLFGDEPGAPIVATSPTNPGFERHWQRLSEGVDEVIEARIYSGIHYRSADEDGAQLGGKVARFVVNHALRARRNH